MGSTVGHHGIQTFLPAAAERSVTVAAIAVERRRYTLDEFLELIDELAAAGSWDWFEIIEGALVAHASPRDPHMRAAVACLLYLGDAQRAGYGRAGTDRTVVLDYQGPGVPVHEAYKPDAFFVVNERVAILDHPEVPSVVGAPDIVVEVLSPTTSRFDRPPRGGKFRGYQRAGVRYYWLVDTMEQTVTTYERQGERLIATGTLRAGDTLRCPLFPELGLAVDTLFHD